MLFLEPEISLLWSEITAVAPNHEPVQSSHPVSFISFRMREGVLNGLFP